MSFDSHANFAQSSVSIPPSPGISGTTLTVLPTDGSKFPAAPFNATLWPNGSIPNDDTSEIVRVTNVAGDVFTIVRAQEGTSAQSIDTTYAIAATATVKTLTDIESQVTTLNNAVNFFGLYTPALTAAVTVANTTSQTTLSGIAIAANAIAANQAYKIKIFFTFSTTGTPNLTLKAMYGGTAGTLLVSGPVVVTPSGAASYSGTAELNVVFPSTTTALASLSSTINTAANSAGTGTSYLDVVPPGSPISVVTTSAKTLEIDAVWGTAAAGNTLTAYGIVQRLA
jgi:hypothetical protein